MATARDIIHTIALMPREEIEADLRDIQTDKQRVEFSVRQMNNELEQLRIEEELLIRVLRMESAVESLKLDEVAKPPDTPTVLEPPTARPKRGAVSQNVLEIVREASPRRVKPAEIGNELARRGIDADGNAVRVALRRWADRRLIVKDGYEYYAEPSGTLIQQDQQEMASGEGVHSPRPNLAAEAPGEGGDRSFSGAPHNNTEGVAG